MMKKTVLATLVLLLCSAWALAQQGYGQSSQSSSSGSKTTVRGCLSKSDTGGYTLTDKSGTTYQLAGDTSKLSAHVGHEVQIKGTKAESSAASASSGAGANPQIEVSGLKHISETCSSAGKTEKSSEQPMSEKPPTSKPMSEKPPTSR